MEIPAGTLVGVCSNHGPVVGDALEDNLPAKCRCAVCGSVLDEVRTTDKEIEVADGKVTGEV